MGRISSGAGTARTVTHFPAARSRAIVAASLPAANPHGMPAHSALSLLALVVLLLTGCASSPWLRVPRPPEAPPAAAPADKAPASPAPAQAPSGSAASVAAASGYGVLASIASTSVPPGPSQDTSSGAGEGWGHAAAWYVPNRVFDLLDIVRARLRLGPGLALGARLTQHADLHVGAEASAWLGLPGPRGAAYPNWPGGAEWRDGPLDVFGLDDYPELRPYDAPWQIGLGLQLGLIGADVAVAPTEAWDALVGLAGFDPAGDDI